VQKVLDADNNDSVLLGLISHITDSLSDTKTPDLSMDEKPIAIAGKDRLISTLQLKTLNDPLLKRMAFKQGVRRVDIETSSQCNRRCSYCTNSVSDRFSSNNFIDDSILDELLDQLSEIVYDQDIIFVGLNEPLMHRKHILESIRRTSAKLPKANLAVITNGDFLDQLYLHELVQAGLNDLIISIHTAPEQSYSDSEMISRILHMGKKLGIDPVLTGFEKSCSVSARLPYPCLQIIMVHGDYSRHGHDRGGLLPNVGAKQQRMTACLYPFTQFTVGYTGYVMPCCVMVSDNIQHEPYRGGKISRSHSIFDIYSGERFVALRRSMITLGPKSGPCKTCNTQDGAEFAMDARPLINL
jgi:hypothetical protein